MHIRSGGETYPFCYPAPQPGQRLSADLRWWPLGHSRTPTEGWCMEHGCCTPRTSAQCFLPATSIFQLGVGVFLFFFHVCKDLGGGGEVRQITPSLHFFYFLFSLFFLLEITLHKAIPLFRPGLVHNGSVSWDDCGSSFHDELRVSLFPWEVPTLCLVSMVSPLQLCWVKCTCMFTCGLPLALLAERPVFYLSLQ